MIKSTRSSSVPPATPKNTPAKKAYHSDEEPENMPQRIKRFPTHQKDVNLQPKALLMDEPLLLFDRYDIEGNRKLNISQFVAMIGELYCSNCTDNKDNKDNNDDELFQNKIRDTFRTIDKMNGSNGSFLYGENMYNLEAELQKFGRIPARDEFLSLCIDIFGNFNENKNKNDNNKTKLSSKEDLLEDIDNKKAIAELKDIARSHTRMKSAVEDLCAKLPFEDETNLSVAETMMRHINDTVDDICLLVTTSEEEDDDDDNGYRLPNYWGDLVCKKDEFERAESIKEKDLLNQQINKLQQQLEQCHNKIIAFEKSNYNLNSVLTSYDDEKEQKEQKNDLDAYAYNEIFIKHNNFMSEWNTTTKQIAEILHCSEDEKHDQLSGETLYNEYISSLALINVQTQRLEKVLTNNHILELLKKQQDLTNIQTSLDESIHITQQSLRDISKQYDTVQNKRKGLQQKLTDLFTECNNLIQNENNLFITMKQKESILKKKQAQCSGYKASSSCCKSLINAYSDFTKKNNVNIEKVKIFLKTKWKSFEQQWNVWTLSDMVAWFKYKTKGKDLANTDWKQIEEELSKQNFKCSSLDSVEQNDLYMFGFTDYAIRKYLSQQIRVLVTKYPLNNSSNENMDDNVNDDTGIPLKYICPITKNIMNDPVVAFDCMTYERSAILEYLKQHNKSPITGVVAFSDALFPNMKLKEEIELYKMTNMNKCDLGYQIEGDESTIYVD